MPETTGKTGLGTIVKLGDGASPETFATIANVVSIEGGGFTLELVDATHLGSPNYLREWLPSLRSAQAWNMNVQYDPTHATHDATTGFKYAQDNRRRTGMQIDMSGAGFAKVLHAEGYFTEVGNVSMTVDGLMSQTVTFQPTGNVYLNDAV